MAKSNIGFMQGRLSPLVKGKIQAFPQTYWEREFPKALELKFALMEWTLDLGYLQSNPLMTADGRKKIVELSSKFHVEIQSLTCDWFMEEPFFKVTGKERDRRLQVFRDIISACDETEIKCMVIPLVDNASVSDSSEEEILVTELLEYTETLKKTGLNISFESDYAPSQLSTFIERFPEEFGINYDSGNSGSLGYDPDEEMRAYGHRIKNVHVKDRVLGGSTVPLGLGAVDFDKVFSGLADIGYLGNLILQTARSGHGAHGEVLTRYRDFVLTVASKYH